VGNRLKIFFHDNCFDGAASAAIFADFYRQRDGGQVDVALQGVQHQQGDPFAGLAIDGDDNACLDFRYNPSPRMTWWFDHHVSAFQPPELRDRFEADDSGQKFYDPSARSNTKFMTGVLTGQLGYQLPAGFDELVHWADIIDGAQFASPAVAVELDEPALQLMTWLEANRDPDLTRRYIQLLGRAELAEIAAQPWIRGPLQPILDAHQQTIELIRKRAVVDGGVVFFDLTDDDVESFNKFISYFLHPDAAYTIGLTAGADRVKISVGSNPWAPERRRHNIAAICERYGGGGHPVVGAVSLPPGEVARGREIAATIRAELAG
jgi:hypothetical protein